MLMGEIIGKNQGEEISVSLRAAEGKGKGRNCWGGHLVLGRWGGIWV